MQPTDHMSTAVVYSIAPKSSSGALYQIVTTSWVNGLKGIEKALARPKSASLR
jgi:hypothetical protein